MTETKPQVWIADDGELTDVREAFMRLGAEIADPPKSDPGVEIPLLVTSAAYAREALETGAKCMPRHHLHLVVGDTAEEGLENIPCDFLLRRPVSKEVLRLLIERARYEGPERRRMTRVAIGSPVTLRNGGWEQQAILAQVSVGGCGLVAGFPLDVGGAIRIELPKELTGPRHLELSGQVLSCRRTTTADGDTLDVSICFDTLGLSDRVTVRALMAGQPIDFRPQPDRRRETRGDAPRRGARRRPVGGRKGVARVVIARDLTTRGMRIELDPALSAGLSLEIALYGSGSSESILLRGRTERDPDEDAWRVHFEGMEECAAREIEKLRAGDDGEAPSFVIAEILDER